MRPKRSINRLSLYPRLLLIAGTISSGTYAEEIDDIFARFNGTDVPGCTLAIDRPDSDRIVRAWGMADLEHSVTLKPDSVIEAGSVSKQFTAAALILLAQDDKLSLEDDVRDYIPELPNYGETITLRQLINHTSGLRDWGSIVALQGRPRGTQVYTHEDVIGIASAQTALNYVPGDAYSYTNTGYNLIAIIVSRVSGMSFAEFTRLRLFEPLGMSHTEWRDDYRRVVTDRAIAYSKLEDGYVMNMPFENVHGNGGLLTTASDLLTWTANLVSGEIGGQIFVDAMHRRGTLNSDEEIGYASGLMYSTHRGLEEIGHSGGTAGYRAYLTRLPQENTAVAVLCNRSDAGAHQLAYQVLDQLLNLPPEAAPEETQVEGDLQSYAGSYRRERNGSSLRFTVKDGQLLLNGQIPLERSSQHTFRMGSSILRFDAELGREARRGFSVQTAGGPERYSPMAYWKPTTEHLKTLAGTYSSRDANAKLLVTVRDGNLFVENQDAEAIQLDPVFSNTFAAGASSIRFESASQSKNTTLHVITERLWDLPFTRQ